MHCLCILLNLDQHGTLGVSLAHWFALLKQRSQVELILYQPFCLPAHKKELQ